MQRRSRATSTSNFGVSRRESHDSSDFYARFAAPTISNDATVRRQPIVDWIQCLDAREMANGTPPLEPNSVALVVTSPPYFAGKAYEEALGEGHIPASYVEYLDMLTEVFARCVEVLEPGGRIAVNVANLGRKPYRSLAADVVGILQDRLKLLLRGEIIWRKAEGASGNCAWGSFQSASNPVLRDLTERVIIASKGRFDRAIPKPDRAARGLPHEDTIAKEDFMTWTTDVWDIPTESATRVGHPAPFPVELPQRLIELYTYRGDLVLDPFMGSGSTAVAAVNTHRHYVGYDTDPAYVAAARERADRALREREERERSETDDRWWFVPPPLPADGSSEDFQARAVREGRMAKELAREILEVAQFHDIKADCKIAAGVEVNFACKDAHGNNWYFDVSGAFSRGNSRAGLRRTDTLWKAIGKAAVIQASGREAYRLVLLTTDLPPRNSAGGRALQAVLGPGNLVFDAIEMLSAEGQRRLKTYAKEGPVSMPTAD
ncbi:MAG: site-specific DNA-methyltransferase [Acidimicrobiales bacterium]